MKTTAHGWTVIDEVAGVLSYEYPFRKGSTSIAMTARLADSSLLVVSPPCGVSDAVMRDLEPFGRVRALVANNSLHHLGLPEWHKAHPEATIYGAGSAMARINRKHPSLPKLVTVEELAKKLGAKTRVHTLPGVSNGELWLEVGSTWYVSDTFFNMQEVPKGLVGMIFKWTGSGPGFSVNGIQKALFVKDKATYKRWALDLLGQSTPTVVVPSHGAIEYGGHIGQQMRALIEARF